MRKQQQNSIPVTYVPIDTLMVSHKNPRTITEGDLHRLMESITEDPEFIKLRPILVNRTNGLLVVYAGAQRLEACKRLHYKEVPCMIEDNLPLQLLEYRMLADNVHAGQFDESKVYAEFSKELADMVWGKEFTDSPIVTQEEKAAKPITHKLVFNDKDDLNRLYLLHEDLKMQFPEDTVGQRVIRWLVEQTI